METYSVGIRIHREKGIKVKNVNPSIFIGLLYVG